MRRLEPCFGSGSVCCYVNRRVASGPADQSAAERADPWTVPCWAASPAGLLPMGQTARFAGVAPRSSRAGHALGFEQGIQEQPRALALRARCDRHRRLVLVPAEIADLATAITVDVRGLSVAQKDDLAA